MPCFRLRAQQRVLMRFVIGSAEDAQQERALEAEMQEFGAFLRLSVLVGVGKRPASLDFCCNRLSAPSQLPPCGCPAKQLTVQRGPADLLPVGMPAGVSRKSGKPLHVPLPGLCAAEGCQLPG